MKKLITITACACALAITLGAVFCGVMYADYILQQAKAKNVPSIEVKGDYPTVIMSKDEIEVSGVTENEKN